MSRENVELAIRSLEAFQATRRPSKFTAPDYVWDMSGFPGWLDQAEYHGAQEFMEFFTKWTEPYEEWDMEIEDFLDAGDARVVGILRQRGRPPGSKAWVELRFGLVYTIADGLIQRAQVFAPPEDALRAVGLAPQQRSP